MSSTLSNPAYPPRFDRFSQQPTSAIEHRPAAASRVRRRASMEQGQALESLGHAVEYLVDSRMFLLGEHNRTAETEAVQILMRLSRHVFAECQEVVPLRERLTRFARRHLG